MQPTSSPDSRLTRRSWLRPIPILLGIITLAGAVVSGLNQQSLNRLRRQHDNLIGLVGELEITDPTKVSIVAVSPEVIESPAWLDHKFIWVYRIYIPANYGICYESKSGRITADSPRSSSGGSSSWRSGTKEPMEIQLILTISPDGKGWTVSSLSNNGCSNSSLGEELNLNDAENFLFEPIVELGETAKSFSADEAICLLRIRSKTPEPPQESSQATKPGAKLFQGYFLYLLDSKRRDAFEAWSDGRTDKMEIDLE